MLLTGMVSLQKLTICRVLALTGVAQTNVTCHLCPPFICPLPGGVRDGGCGSSKSHPNVESLVLTPQTPLKESEYS